MRETNKKVSRKQIVENNIIPSLPKNIIFPQITKQIYTFTFGHLHYGMCLKKKCKEHKLT